MKYLISLLVLSTNLTFALTSIDLSAPGGSFEHFRTQDQNGLGTCYANTASAILESILPSNSEVSYLDLAIRYKESIGISSAIGSSLDAGYVCKTINAAKASGGVCPRSDTLFESYAIHGDKANISRRTLEELDKVYDSMERMSEEEKEFFIQQLEDLYSTKLNLALQTCRDSANERAKNLFIYPSLATVADKIRREIKKIQNSKPSNYKEQIRKLKKSQKYLKNKVIYNPPLEIIRDRNKIVRSKELERIIDETYRPYVTNFSAQQVDEIPNFERQVFEKMGLDDFPHLYQGTISMHRIDQDKAMISPEECAKKEALNILSNYGLANTALGNVVENCDLHFQLNTTASYLSHLIRHVPILADASLFELLRNSSNRSELLRNAFKINCDGNLIQIPNNTTCRSYNAKDLYNTKTKSANEIVEEMRSIIHQQLSNDRPVGIGVCSIFMRERGINTKFGRDELCTGGGMHQLHAMTVIGFREKTFATGEIKREYLLQNSWGEDCGYQPTQENCIGETGRFWVEESELLLNTRRIDEISLN